MNRQITTALTLLGIEATKINIATKTAGRIVDIMAKEGDFVTASFP